MNTLKRIAVALESIAAELHAQNAAKSAKKPRQYKGKKAWKRDENKAILDMRNAGWSYKQIARRLGRSESACSAHYWALTKRNKI